MARGNTRVTVQTEWVHNQRGPGTLCTEHKILGDVVVRQSRNQTQEQKEDFCYCLIVRYAQHFLCSFLLCKNRVFDHFDCVVWHLPQYSSSQNRIEQDV